MYCSFSESGMFVGPLNLRLWKPSLIMFAFSQPLVRQNTRQQWKIAETTSTDEWPEAMPRQHSTTKTNNEGVPLQCKLVVFRPLPHECPQVSNFERATNLDSVSWPCSRTYESTPNVPAVLPAIMERITEYHRIYQSIYQSIRVYQFNSYHTSLHRLHQRQQQWKPPCWSSESSELCTVARLWWLW